MTARTRIATIIGARPQFVKAAAVSRAFRKAPGLQEILIHTGQHFDANMSDVFFTELELPKPDVNLDIHGGGHGAMTGRMMEALESRLMDLQPHAVLIYGDTNSTLAAALVAAKLHIPVFHVEAGLRSFNRRMPEEVNRVVADHLSALLFCPTQRSVTNLANEGITKGVHQVGDVMYDAVLHARAAMLGQAGILETLELKPGGYALATIHRAENTDDEPRFRKVLDYLGGFAKSQPVVFPVHPRTRAVLERLGIGLNGFKLIDPVSYSDMHRLLAGASVVLTDSGGVQKEAYFHRVPCVTMRDETEWVETIEAGWNRLWTVPDFLPRRVIADYGDGKAAEKIVEAIVGALT